MVVATVNGREIYGDAFLKEYDSFKKRIKLSDANDEELEKQMREGVLDNLVKEAIIAEEAEKAGIKITKGMEDEAIQSMLKGFSQARLQEILEKRNQTYEEWKESVRKNLLMDKLIAAKVAPLVDIPEEEIKQYYAEKPDEFKKPAQAHVYHILCASRAEADAVRAAIAGGADFSATASRSSKSPEAAQGGDLGMVSQGQMPNELDEAIFKLGVKELSKVVESPYGFHIIKVTEFAKPRQETYAEAKESIYKHMFHERLEGRFDEWLKETKSKASVQVFLDRLYRL